jgi:prepilin-type N-terminal cleavage/methylation domain-containing protein
MAKRRGFTLAETLVALMVFSMALSLLGVAATNLKQHYQSNRNQQREAQVARSIMSLEAPETGLTLKTCFKRQLILYSKITDKKYYLDVRHKAFGLYTRQGGNMRYLNQVSQVTYEQLSKQRVQATIQFEEGVKVTQEITFYEKSAG